MIPEHVKTLRAAQRRLERATAHVEAARQLRDQAIRDCVDQGMNGAEIARAIGLTRGRVAQVLGGYAWTASGFQRDSSMEH